MLRKLESLRAASLGGFASPAFLRRSLARVRDDVHWLALSPIAREVSRRRLTYLPAGKLRALEDSARDVNLRDDDRAHRRYDTIRNGCSAGIGGDDYCGYVDNLFAVVVDNFRLFGFEPDGRPTALHQGLFKDTLRFRDGQSVALAHIDCDWHDAVSYCLEAICERLSPGGIIILDDYNDYGGGRVATGAFLARHSDMELRSRASNAVLQRHPAV